MKPFKPICLFLCGAALAAAASDAESSRTDINPALLYFQAFQTAPDLAPADRNFLFDPDWRGQKLPARFGELVSHYDAQFTLVRQAAHATLPCDWGIDLSRGPDTLLPHLAKAKAVSQAARLRAMWDLQTGRQADAADDLLAAFTLGRNTSRDGTVISVLVQFAIENIVLTTVAGNFHQFTPETLRRLADGFDAAPPRASLASAISTETATFPKWLIERIKQLQKEHPGSETKELAKLFGTFESSDEPSTTGPADFPKPTLWEQVSKAGGGTTAGVIKLIEDELPMYERLQTIMALPRPEYEVQIAQFSADLQQSSNPFATLTIPALENTRPKEFGVQASLAMTRAAIQYKLRGVAGLQSVPDPFGMGGFKFDRFVFEGVDRGFKLTSAYAARGYPEALVFVEKDGPAFSVYGKLLGRPVENPSPAK